MRCPVPPSTFCRTTTASSRCSSTRSQKRGGVAQPVAAEKVLRRFLRTAPGFERLDLHAADGAVLVTTGPAASTARPPAARERAVLAVLSLARTHDGPQVGPHSWRDADGHEWLPIAMRVLEAATGRTNYILVAQVRLDEASLWFEIRLPARTAAAMLADRGDILVARGDAIAEGREGPVWKTIRALGFPSSGIVTTGSLLDGSARTQAFHRVDGRSVTVFAGIPHAALWAAWFERGADPVAGLRAGLCRDVVCRGVVPSSAAPARNRDGCRHRDAARAGERTAPAVRTAVADPARCTRGRLGGRHPERTAVLDRGNLPHPRSRARRVPAHRRGRTRFLRRSEPASRPRCAGKIDAQRAELGSRTAARDREGAATCGSAPPVSSRRDPPAHP